MQISVTQYKKWQEIYRMQSPSIRVGQSFCNYFNITDSELFNTENKKVAFDIIFERYVR